MIYFTADLHLFHENIRKIRNCPFQTVEQMNKSLIRNWNQKVGPKDEVYILGDVSWKGKEETRVLLK